MPSLSDLLSLLSLPNQLIAQPLAALSYGPVLRGEVRDVTQDDAYRQWNSTHGLGWLNLLDQAREALPTHILAQGALGLAKSLEDIAQNGYQQTLQKNIQSYQDQANPYQRFVLETALDPTSYLVGPLGKAASLGLKGALKVGEAAKDLPILSHLFSLTPEALAGTVEDNAATLAARLLANGISRERLVRVLDQFSQGKITPELVKGYLKLGQTSLGLVGHLASDLLPDLKALAQRAESDEDFYQQLPKIARAYANQAFGAKNTPPGRFLQAWSNLNQAVRELMLSGGTSWIGNLLDIVTKGKLHGIPVHQILEDLPIYLRHGQFPELQQFMKGNILPRELGTDVGVLVSPEHRQPLLEALSSQSLAKIGAGLGVLSGDPINILIGALAGPLSKLGFKANMAMMRLLENTARTRFFLEGARKYLAGEDIADFFAPKLRDEKFAKLVRDAGSQAQALLDRIKERGYLLNPDDVYQEALNLGMSRSRAARVRSAWRDLHDEAIQAGISLVQKAHFNYTRDTNLVSALRKFTPFPVWPIHNLPYYLTELSRRPDLAGLVGLYGLRSLQQQQALGLPDTRFGMRIPIGRVGDQTLYLNPLAPLSITSQLSLPNQTDLERGTPLDRLLALGDALGIGLLPTAEYIGQSVGLLDRGRDLPTFSPWTRMLVALAQGLTGQVHDPEYALKVPGEVIRSQLAPQAVPDISYPEYQVRKRLAELSLQTTGKPWQEVPEFVRAMVDPTSTLYQEAARQAGMESLGLQLGRRILPFEESLLPDAEAAIRQQRARLQPMVDAGIIPYQNLVRMYPTAFTYSALQTAPLELKLQYYLSLRGPAQQVFLQENPDLAQYLTWQDMRIRGMLGRQPRTTIQEYLSQQRK